MNLHRLIAEIDDGDEIVLACTHGGCGRQLVLRRSGGYTVIHQGDFAARHHYSSGPMEISTTLGA